MYNPKMKRHADPMPITRGLVTSLIVSTPGEIGNSDGCVAYMKTAQVAINPIINFPTNFNYCILILLFSTKTLKAYLWKSKFLSLSS